MNGDSFRRAQVGESIASRVGNRNWFDRVTKTTLQAEAALSNMPLSAFIPQLRPTQKHQIAKGKIPAGVVDAFRGGVLAIDGFLFTADPGEDLASLPITLSLDRAAEDDERPLAVLLEPGTAGKIRKIAIPSMAWVDVDIKDLADKTCGPGVDAQDGYLESGKGSHWIVHRYLDGVATNDLPSGFEDRLGRQQCLVLVEPGGGGSSNVSLQGTFYICDVNVPAAETKELSQLTTDEQNAINADAGTTLPAETKIVIPKSEDAQEMAIVDFDLETYIYATGVTKAIYNVSGVELSKDRLLGGMEIDGKTYIILDPC